MKRSSRHRHYRTKLVLVTTLSAIVGAAISSSCVLLLIAAPSSMARKEKPRLIKRIAPRQKPILYNDSLHCMSGGWNECL